MSSATEGATVGVSFNVLDAISPIDGRYRNVVSEVQSFYSERTLMRYRIMVEIEYLVRLFELLGKHDCCNQHSLAFGELNLTELRQIYNHENFDLHEAQIVKEFERSVNHDVKAIEYYIRSKMDVYFTHLTGESLIRVKEFVHFGLTSQDVNNVAIPLMIKNSMTLYYECLADVLQKLKHISDDWMNINILARTHGQPATPTSLGKEIYVWVYRVESQLTQLKSVPHSGKFGGATGQFNAHYTAFPSIDWIKFADEFLQSLGLVRETWTTQISNYDNLAALLDNLRRINIILIDLCRDFWQYNSIGYFKQKLVSSEVGSSAMPHKVNPIDFENAEGNLGMANAIFEFMSSKLPISRLQRDLTDSTVLRNMGVPFSHTIIALRSIFKGLSKITLNAHVIDQDLAQNYAIVSEAIQTILRREGYQDSYRVIKDLTRVDHKLDKTVFTQFISNLDGISNSVKTEMLNLTPHNYTGKFPEKKL